MKGRNRRQPEVDGASVLEVPRDAPVVRAALLGDVDVREDLDAAHDSLELGHGNAVDLTQDSVHARPDRRRLGAGREVKIGSSPFHRPAEYGLDDPYGVIGKIELNHPLVLALLHESSHCR